MSLLIAIVLTAAAADPWADVAETAGMEVSAVKAMVAGVEKDDTVLERMARPWEAKPWRDYKKIFEDDARHQAGLAFWAEHAEALAAAEAKTGVPPRIIVAIIGVETRYGEVMGNDDVVRSLYTLGFFHAKRGTFFRKELGHYLRLATDEGWEIGSRKGSYAGAMGLGQFIPSSYRAYAVDGDGDGIRDLFGSPEDAIASVANYFAKHGWKPGESVLHAIEGEGLEGLVTDGRKPNTTWGQVAQAGATTKASLEPTTPVRVFDFEGEQGTEYAVGRTNFFVITQYNHSKLYARAVYELSERLAADHSAR